MKKPWYRRILIFSLVLCLLVPVGTAHAATATQDPDAKYYQTGLPRYEAPSPSNPYYNEVLNVFAKGGVYGLPNCTCYAWGRAYEYYGVKPMLSQYNAGRWWVDNINSGAYEYGQTPRVGAVAVWDKWDQSNGHVAFVEAVNGDEVHISESHYQGLLFTNPIMRPNGTGSMGGSYRFLGYIYVDRPYKGQSSLPGEQWVLKRACIARTTPGLSGEIWRTIPQGAALDITETRKADGSLWGKFSYSGRTAWVILNYAYCVSDPSLTPDPVEEEYPTPLSRMPATTGGLWLYEGPGTQYKAAVKLEAGTLIKVQATADGIDYVWGRLTYQNKTYWCIYEMTAPYKKEQAAKGLSLKELYGYLCEKTVEGRPPLTWGNVSGDTAQLQIALNLLGFSCGEVDGSFGTMTKNALLSFQQKMNLEVDGEVGAQTWNALYEAARQAQNGVLPWEEEEPVVPDDPEDYSPKASDNDWYKELAKVLPTGRPDLRIGSLGQHVTALQKALNALGCDCGTVDGDFGSATAAGVKTFQSQHDQVADGLVAQQTWKAIYKALRALKNPVKQMKAEEVWTELKKTKPSQRPNVSIGGAGSEAALMEQALNVLGYNSGSPDGSIDTQSVAAIKKFQKEHSLTADGWFGRKSWTALYTAVRTHLGLPKSDQPKDAADPADDPVVEPTPQEEKSWNSGYRELAKVERTSRTDLMVGAEGDDVLAFQKALRFLGYTGTQTDGTFSLETELDAKHFQKSAGLTADGWISQEVWKALYEAVKEKGQADPGTEDPPVEPQPQVNPVYEQLAKVDVAARKDVQYGSMNNDVAALQTALNALGFNCGTVDGDFGYNTENGVKAFQSRKALSVTGKVNQTTWQALYEAARNA